MAEKDGDEVSPWRDGFLFLGNQLALDFLNTRPIQNGEPTELLPDITALLRWFCAAGLLNRRQMADLQQHWEQADMARHVMGAVWDLREKLRKQILRWENGGNIRHSFVEKLNRLTGEHPMRTRLIGSGKKLSTEHYFEPRNPQDLFAPLADSAAMLFTSVNRERLRKCNQCVLHFVDTSKKGTRRWCSMQLCGNRLKVAAYAARKRSVDIGQ